MTTSEAAASARAAAILSRTGLDALVTTLVSTGYTVVGPVMRDGAITLDTIESAAELPAGWGVETAPGRYRVHRRTDAAVFGHAAGSQSWKQFLHPPRRTLWTSDGQTFRPTQDREIRYAFLGVRACDLAAINTLGTVLAGGPQRDDSFHRRTRDLLVIAVGCTEPGGVCFCASMGTGPQPGPGYDLSLTEQIDAAGHRFVVDVGTEHGARILAQVETSTATAADVDAAREAVLAAAGRMGRQMPPTDLRALLVENRESPLWSEVADRCLTCGNCTMVCPTCFCTTTEDSTALGTGESQRSQRWASCFEADFSYLHGGSVRASGASRYRQWMTHKLSSWHDQFGGSGCVGCGRCIAWCPVGIDITEEAGKLAAARDNATPHQPTQ